MLNVLIPIAHRIDGLWQAGQCVVEVDGRRIELAAAPPEDLLEDVIETMMGRALLCLDQNGRRGTSEPIAWGITVDDVLHCYRCIEPMRPCTQQPEQSAEPASQRWECKNCGYRYIAPFPG
ncbi:MAG: hypothetical protein AB7G68_03845 [Nitrospiraceae bacterium]